MVGTSLALLCPPYENSSTDRATEFRSHLLERHVDLSTLYGNTEKEHERVRTYHNGLIFPDSIASERIMMMPPGVVAVLLMFSRNHNHVAESLLSVNEDGKYKPWNELNEKERKWYKSHKRIISIKNSHVMTGRMRTSFRSHVTSTLGSLHRSSSKTTSPQS